MSHDLDVLRALLGLTSRRKSPTLDDLSLRLGSEPDAVRRSLFSLARNGLVQRTSGGLRLSLAGLAVAVAAGGPTRRARKKARPADGARAKPLPRVVRTRRRAA